MPKIDIAKLPVDTVSLYPDPFRQVTVGRERKRLGNAVGLNQFGVNMTTLKPGAWSSQRHWHRGEDELLVMIAGEAVLVEDAGRTSIRPGDICVWPADAENGHHLINESDSDCVFVAISAGPDGGGSYPDIDMCWTADGTYRHMDGTAYPETARPA